MQGEIIAGAIAASATVETDAITIDPERLLELQRRRELRPVRRALSGLEFPINPERVAPVLRRLVSPTNTRARIYDRDGVLHPRQPQPLRPRRRAALRPAAAERRKAELLSSAPGSASARWLGRGDLPLYRELGAENGKGYPEVAQALDRPQGQHGARSTTAAR